MPQHASVSKILRLSDGVKYVKVPHTVSIRDYGSDGYLWIYPSAVINITPGSSDSNISNTLQTLKGEVILITVYPSGCLVGLGDGW